MNHDFEFRRVIFGLSSIVNTPPQSMPGLVNERLADIVKQMAMIAEKMRGKRLEILKDNEDHIKDEMKKINSGADD